MIPVLALQSFGRDLVQLIVESAVVALLVIFAFSLALKATIHATEARATGRHAAVVSWSVLAMLGYAAFLASAVLAIYVVTNK